MRYTIVGQGLAGTLMAYNLIKRGHTVEVFDAPKPNAASKVAAGILNPFTGRNFVKSWLYDDLYATALRVYPEIEAFLETKFFYPQALARALADIKAENDWLVRPISADEQTTIVTPELSATFNHFQSFAVFPYAGRCDLRVLTEAFRVYFKASQTLVEDAFDYTQVPSWPNPIIFCEGYGVTKNPYFAEYPAQPSKGEVLIVRIPNYPFVHQLVKHDLMIAPLGDDLYWVGSNYDNTFESEATTPAIRTDFEERLKRVLQLPFEVVEHRAAVRPAVKGRRPVMGQHVEMKHVYCFNGLGAKGSSLAPYFAEQMTDLVVDGVALMKEVAFK